MDSKSFTLKLALLTSLISSGTALAQTLPDEINHTKYLQIYQGLDTVLQQKTVEYQRLATQKASLEAQIAQMVKDQIDIPARNNELAGIIANKRAEMANLNQQIAQLESVLNQVIDDLKRLDNILAQLGRDNAEQMNRLNAIGSARTQAANETQVARARLEQEMREEAETGRTLQRLNNDFNQANDQKQQNDRERRDLTRDVDQFRREVVNFRAAVQQNTNMLNTKKPLLAELQSKLPAIKADVANQQAKVNAAEANLSPERSKLAQMTNSLNAINAQIAALTSESTQLNAKITQNRARMNNMNNASLEQAKVRLEQEVAALTAQSQGLRDAYTINDTSLNEKRVKKAELMTQLRQYAPRTPDFMRVSMEIRNIENEIENLEKYLKQVSRQLQPIDAQIGSKNQQIAQYAAAMTANDQQRVALQNEITAAEAKIVENTNAIAAKQTARTEGLQAVSAQSAVVNGLETQKAEASRELAKSQAFETQLNNQIGVTAGEVQRLERDIASSNARITEMESAIASYPQNIQRLEAHNRRLEDRMMECRRDINLNERLLARIQQGRVDAQRTYDAFAGRLDQINQDFAQNEAQARVLQEKIKENQTQRDTLARYNQDSIRKYDSLKTDLAAADKEIKDATNETTINNQDLNTIATELPKLRSDLGNVTPRVGAALASKEDAERKAQSASVDYQNRRSLFDRYLGESRVLGQERGIVGTNDGSRDGSQEARNVAQRLSSENGTAEGKWLAIRRGYIRGEISGFGAGFEVGMASQADLSRGEAEGKLSGAKRAKDEANLVKKPVIYLGILADRLQNDDPSTRKLVSDIVKSNMSSSVNPFQDEIPELSDEEIQRAKEILSSLDPMIEQSNVEISKVREIRNRIQDSRNVYSTPSSAPGAQNGDCTGVYKNVKEYVDACKATFAARYQSLYNASHAESFHSNYGTMFATGVERSSDAELLRQYGTYSAEAIKVGREVGLAAGKEEIYKQSFQRSEIASYSENAPKEEARVTDEAQNLVQDLLAKNPAVAQKGAASVDMKGAYGISPGAEGSVKLALKNIGNIDSASSSLVRLTEVSPNLVIDQRESVIPSVPGRSLKDVNVLNVKVADMAVPGSRVVIAGEIIHPGNLYRATRSETFRIDTTLAINPEAAVNVDYDVDPKISGLFGGINKHDIEVTLSPKYFGVKGGYTVSIEEVGGRNTDIVTKSVATGELQRNALKKVELQYKIKKEAKGKQTILRLTVKNGETVVKTTDLSIMPK
ncbi:MAG: hypothetical protein V4598_10185 [Bdellovibrionota bacterium]